MSNGLSRHSRTLFNHSMRNDENVNALARSLENVQVSDVSTDDNCGAVEQLSDSGICVGLEKSSDVHKESDGDAGNSTDVSPSSSTSDEIDSKVSNTDKTASNNDDTTSDRISHNNELHLNETNITIIKIQHLNGNFRLMESSANICSTHPPNFQDYQTQFHIAETAFDFISGNSPRRIKTRKVTKITYFKKSLHSTLVLRQGKKGTSKPLNYSNDIQQNRMCMYKTPIRLLDKKVKTITKQPDHISLEDALDDVLFHKQSKMPNTETDADLNQDNKSPKNENRKHSDQRDRDSKPVSSEMTTRVGQICAFCDDQASTACQNCCYRYCDRCLAALHPLVGPFARHSLVPTGFTVNITRCEDHDLPCKLPCLICQKEVCIDCCTTRCKYHFQKEPSLQDRDTERVQLLTAMEKLTFAMDSLNIYNRQMEDETLQIEMLTLYKRERLRQEFVSFHELLIESEDMLCKQLEKDERVRLSSVWRGQEEALSRLRNDETALTSLAVDLLQTDNTRAFLEGKASLTDRFSNLHKEISEFHKTWAKGSMRSKQPQTPLLCQPFSLFQEKTRLNESIQCISGQEPRVEFLQKTLCVELDEPVRLESCISVTGLGPSTTMNYQVQLYATYHGEHCVVWETSSGSLKGIHLNVEGTYIFEGGARYLLKLLPTSVCQLNAIRHQTTACCPTHMLIVVGVRLWNESRIPNTERVTYRGPNGTKMFRYRYKHVETLVALPQTK